jgi:fumarate reductase flavoprotein subunit
MAADWRNASTAQVKAQYKRSAATDAALAINEGSAPPDFQSGPVWAIFDSAAAARTGWKLRYPYVADPPDGYFHKADTVAELAHKVMANPHQKMPLKYLEDTVTRYNAFAAKGADDDFAKPVMHRIDTPPFYAAWAPIGMLDSFGGLRINGKAQVIDRWGAVIPGLYAGGESSGGGQQHGLGRASVHGFIAGTNAAQEG